MNEKFIVSDESINSYGFKILTNGINLETFKKNPIMLYMHDRNGGIIGRWENLTIENNILYANAIFDDTTERAKQVKEQVEKGFLRCASIGINVDNSEVIDGVKIVTQCTLVEISIVDIPSNKNAVKLYKKNGQVAINLADALNENEQDEKNDLKTALILLLGLDNQATDKDIINTIKNALKSKNKDIENEIEKALALGFFDKKQKNVFLTLAKSKRKVFDDFINSQKEEQEKEINIIISKALNKGLIISNDVNLYQNIGKKLGIPFVKELINTLKEPIKPLDIINQPSKTNWTLQDYRKFAPEELKNNPKLYQDLKEKNQKNVIYYGLDWYRKNNPEELKNNPKLYQELTNKNKK